jgi:hypothetical protein
MKSSGIVIPLAIAACGSPDDAPCPVEEPTDHGPICQSVQILAARYTAELTPTQAELDETLDVYCRAFEPLRGTLGHPPVATSWTSVQRVSARATDPQIAGAWAAGRLATGIAVVDDVLARASIDRVVAQGADFFSLESERILAPQNIDTALEGVPGLEINAQFVPPIEPFSEVRLEYPECRGGPVDVEFSIGWGDCSVDCTGQHFWLVRVSNTTVTLTEERGDPIPAEVLTVWEGTVAGCE